ncbi:MAG: hypothetical protein CW338_02180 [Clostridiales bacterium]|nr:hypothetical protein [Clostridiales bacterium]
MKKVLSILAVLMLIAAAIPVIAAAGTDPIVGTWEADAEGAIQYMAEYYGLDASFIRSAVGADYSVTYVFCEDGTYSMESMSNGSLLQTSGVYTGENGVYSITSTSTTHENGPGAVSICTLDDEDHMHIGSKESGVYTPYIRVSGGAPAAELSPVVGRWDASDFYCQNSGLNYEDVIAAIPDFAVVIEFTEDGKRITSVTANGSVTQLAENEYTVDGGTLTVDGDSCNWQLENDVLTLSLPGVTVIMPRLPDGPAGAQRPDAIIGTWDGAAILYSPFFDTQEEAEARFGEIAYLHVFRENGTLSVTTTMLGDTHTSDYSYTIDGDTLTIGNDVFSWKVEGDVLTFWNDEISNTLYRVEN